MKRWNRLHQLAETDENNSRRAYGLAIAQQRASAAAVSTAVADRLAAAGAAQAPQFHEQYQAFWQAAQGAIDRAQADLRNATERVEETRQLMFAAHQRTRAMAALVERERLAQAVRDRRYMERAVQERLSCGESSL